MPEAGLNVEPETPVPLHVPPAVPVTNVFKLTFPAAAQIGLGFVHEGSTSGTTVTVREDVSWQGAVPTV